MSELDDVNIAAEGPSKDMAVCSMSHPHIELLQWRDATSAESSETCILGLLGVTTAGFFYPLIVGLALAIGTQDPWLAVSAIVVWPVVGLLGASFASVVGTFSYTFVVMLNWSLGFRFSARTQIGLTGSVAGFACTFWSVVVAAGPRFHVEWIVYLLGPFLGSLMGQLLSVRAAKKQLRISGCADFHDRRAAKPNPLNLRHLFMLTTWAALLAFTVRVLGEIGPPFAIVLACFASQWILVMAVEKCWSLLRDPGQDSSSMIGNDSSASSNTS